LFFEKVTSPQAILKQYWNHDRFRPLQQEIIRAVLEGKDVLALLPTGGGKSICFQVPAMAKEGLCLVVSPLIALMKDQVENLRRRNITAYAVYSGMTRKDVESTLKTAARSNCKFLYVSPERLETGLFKEFLGILKVNLLAVDEAHCISEWGYDFRPPYLRIAALREELPGIPVLALTATATREVEADICSNLRLKNPDVFRQPFFRENLSFSVFRVGSKVDRICGILEKVPGSAIVYCSSRKKTREVSDGLVRHGIHSQYYHAGLTTEDRNERQKEWKNDRIRVMVCTNAFGMGIDKPDVRIVVHADMPDCPENYYQEAGRAGRDGKKAYAVLLYTGEDIQSLNKLSSVRFPSVTDMRKIYQDMVNYLQIPAGSGGDSYFGFDLSDFVKKFQLELPSVTNALKMMEQEEILAFRDQVFLPSHVCFTVNREGLSRLEREMPSMMTLVDLLLRTYPGIFDQAVPVSEKSIAWLLKKPPAEVSRDLKFLQGQGIIQYSPQKDSPQLYLMQPRQKADDLRIDVAHHRRRKKQFEARLGAMLGYLKEETMCRSQMLARYFGDEATGPCGICDNCLRHKKSQHKGNGLL
jgi:ATP-dependent DNA helicase RecQ